MQNILNFRFIRRKLGHILTIPQHTIFTTPNRNLIQIRFTEFSWIGHQMTLLVSEIIDAIYEIDNIDTINKIDNIDKIDYID